MKPAPERRVASKARPPSRERAQTRSLPAVKKAFEKALETTCCAETELAAHGDAHELNALAPGLSQ